MLSSMFGVMIILSLSSLNVSFPIYLWVLVSVLFVVSIILVVLKEYNKM